MTLHRQLRTRFHANWCRVSRGQWRHVLPLVILFVVGLAVSGLGPVPLARGTGYWWQNPIWHMRLIRIAVTACTGLALAAAGAALQGLLRNPLADPYILGISSGAGLGVR
ncbi:MAG: hypothetical protein EOM10_09835, partial [Opitutae bacterium]|nr:hypothetical protein [Opitutae bacterium]